ncbi:MAG: diaminopimelate decarboxylase, partial [Nocardioides marinisabuli]|uniref:diaminopimelate decarboxylase n=1 Tax=Nocardioides marinisabuli TaxID=419476 RepID=UPI0032196B6B
MPVSHEAGWAHADGALKGPAWLRQPADPNELVEHLWSRSARKDDGVLSVGGVALPDLVAEHGSPAYVLDEADFRSRAAAFRDAFADYDVFYAGKAFLCTAVARWVADEGLCLDVCTGGELAVAERAGFPMERVGFHGNNKSPAEIERAVRLGVGRVIADSTAEIERLSEVATRLGTTVRVMVRVTAGVEAHTHEYIATAHEDQKFGFSITSGDALEAVRRVHEAPGLELLGLHSHIGSQIFDSSGFEVAARRVLALHARVADELGVAMPEMDLGGGFGIAYTTQDDPAEPAQLAAEMSAIVEHECRALGIEAPALSIEPGRAIVGPSVCTVYEVGTVKPVRLDGGAVRTYVSVDGGMSDN